MRLLLFDCEFQIQRNQHYSFCLVYFCKSGGANFLPFLLGNFTLFYKFPIYARQLLINWKSAWIISSSVILIKFLFFNVLSSISTSSDLRLNIFIQVYQNYFIQAVKSAKICENIRVRTKLILHFASANKKFLQMASIKKNTPRSRFAVTKKCLWNAKTSEAFIHRIPRKNFHESVMRIFAKGNDKTGKKEKLHNLKKTATHRKCFIKNLEFRISIKTIDGPELIIHEK